MTSLSPCGVRLAFAIIIIAGCAVFREPLEADPVTHMLIQLPALAWAGWLLADVALSHWRIHPASDFNAGGVAGLLIVLFGIAFWMLPRSIDGALTSPEMEFAKFLTVPLFIGAPLRCSWPRAHSLLRGFLMSNALSMLGVLAWLYTAAPIRVCNSYLVSDQQRLGTAFLFVALGLALAWGGRLFFAPRTAITPFADPELDGGRLP
jgi:hypothetical protein